LTGVCMYVCMPGPYQHGRPGAVHLIVSISDSRLNTQTDRQTDGHRCTETHMWTCRKTHLDIVVVVVVVGVVMMR